MRRAFVFRLYPTAEQARSLAAMLETHRRLYNAGLAERRDAWATERRGVTYGQQSAALTATRLTNPFLAATNSASFATSAASFAISSRFSSAMSSGS